MRLVMIFSAIFCTTFFSGCGKSDEDIYNAILEVFPDYTYFTDEEVSFDSPHVTCIILYEDKEKKYFVVFFKWLGLGDEASTLRAVTNAGLTFDWKIISKQSDYGGRELAGIYTGQGQSMPINYTQWEQMKGEEVTFSLLDEDGDPVGTPMKVQRYKKHDLQKGRMISFERFKKEPPKNNDSEIYYSTPGKRRKN